MSNYKRICKGIKCVNDTKYIVTISVTTKPYESKNIHLGSFDSEEEARNILSKANNLKKEMKGEALVEALDGLREKTIKKSKSHCGIKLKIAWRYCPICGKSIA